MVSIQSEQGGIARTIAPVSSLSEAAAAIAVVVLAILGLVGVIPNIMLAVTTIVVGCGILLMGAETAADHPTTAASGITLDFLAGGAAIVLGILAFFAHADVLAPAALIVAGGTLMLMGTATARLSVAETQISGGAQFLIGIAAIILGILAFIPIHAMILTFVGFLAAGAGLLLAAVGNGRFWSLVRT